jgi:type II secretory pathway pseudopilin PulG
MRLKIKPSFPPVDNRLPAGHSGKPAPCLRSRPGPAAFTLMEVVISVMVVALTFAAIIQGYLTSATKGQWTGYSLAAQSLGLQTIEQARSALWDPLMNTNQLASMALLNPQTTATTYTGYTTNVLDVPWKSTNAVVVTNYVSIRTLYADNNSALGVQLQMVRVDTVWPFTGWGKHTIKYYTNTVVSYVAPDNTSPQDLGVVAPAGY